MKSVFFDLDDTLYDKSQPFLRAFEQFFKGAHTESAKAAYRAFNRLSFGALNDHQAGLITRDEMNIRRCKGGLEAVGILVSEEESLVFHRMYEECQKHLELSETMKALLDFCVQSFSHVGLISNGESGHQRAKFNALGLGHWIPTEMIFVSGDCGHLKPDRRIFEWAAGSVPGSEIIYVGDNYDIDIVGSSALGWSNIWFDHSEQRDAASHTKATHIVCSEEEMYACLRSLAE